MKSVADTNGVLDVVPATDDAIKHSVMTRGAPVLAAGEANGAGAGGIFFGLRISNQAATTSLTNAALILESRNSGRLGSTSLPGAWNLLGPSDEDILHLAAMGEEARRDWLLTHQPANPGDRFYWWETLLEAFLTRLRSSAPLTSTRREYSLLAAQATKEAIELQVMPP